MTVCVIQDIDRHWIAALGSEWNLDPDIFYTYFSNPQGASLWEASRVLDPRSYEPRTYHWIDGVLPHLRSSAVGFPPYRRRGHHAYYGWQANCRVMYCRVSAYLCKLHVRYGRTQQLGLMDW